MIDSKIDKNYIQTKSGIYVPNKSIETDIYKIVKPTEDEIMKEVYKNPAGRIQIIKPGNFLDQYASLVNSNSYRR